MELSNTAFFQSIQKLGETKNPPKEYRNSEKTYFSIRKKKDWEALEGFQT